MNLDIEYPESLSWNLIVRWYEDNPKSRFFAYLHEQSEGDIHEAFLLWMTCLDYVDEKEGRFEIPADYHPQHIIQDAFGIIGGTPEKVRLQFTKNTAPYIKERRWHQSQSIEPRPNGELSLSMTVALSAELKNWILGFGPNVRVLGPQILKDEIKTLHQKAAQQ